MRAVHDAHPKKSISMKGISVVAALLVVGGCSFGAAAQGKALPTASASMELSTIDLPRGSFSWASEGQGQSADSAGPDELLKSGYLKPYRTSGGFDVTITFHAYAQPNAVNVRLFKSPDLTGLPLDVSRSSSFTLRAAPPGVYVYVVTGTWPEGDVDFYLPIDLV